MAEVVADKLSSEMVEFGTYKVSGNVEYRAAGRTAAGKIGDHESEELVLSTTVLRAELGAAFGFVYEIRGPYDGEAKGFEIRAIHPALRRPDGRLNSTSTAEVPLFFEGGRVKNTLVYRLSEPYEVAPGTWTLQVLFRGRPLLSKTFTLTE